MRFGGSKESLRAARALLPIGIGDVLEGIAFGALAAPLMGRVAPVALSLAAFSGSAQFAALSVIRAHGSIAAALLAAIALNSRYLAMSGTVSRQMGGGRLRRSVSCLLLSDAAWAISQRGDPKGTRARLVGAGATELLMWTAGTAVGVIVGSSVADPDRLGLDSAYPAFFLWLLAQRCENRRIAERALLGAAAALVLTPFLAPGLPVIAGGLAAAAWRPGR